MGAWLAESRALFDSNTETHVLAADLEKRQHYIADVKAGVTPAHAEEVTKLKAE